MDRRTFLVGAVAGLAAGRAHAAAAQIPFSAGTQSPRFIAPPESCDCHMHIFDDETPSIPGAAVAANVTTADYGLLQTRLRTQRVVFTQPSNYGNNNTIALRTLKPLGPVARAIACCTPDVTDAELQRLKAAGVVGLRFYLNRPSITTVDMVAPLAARVAALGWHFTVILNADQVVANEAVFSALPVPLVLEHFAGLANAGEPAYPMVMKLLAAKRAYVKLTRAPSLTAGVYDYHARDTLAQAFIAAAPTQVLWGSDWPHAAETTQKLPVPDDAQVFDLIPVWTASAAQQRLLLVENPAKLYGF